MKTILLHLATMLALVGCVDLPARTAQDNPAEPKYAEVYRHAHLALQEGKWPIYRRLMRSVIDLSTASGAPPGKRAIYWYEYGRASGVVCDWKDAEFALTVASNLDAGIGGPVHESFNELGRIYVVTKQYDKAVDYFSRAAKAFVQYHEKNPEKKIAKQLGSARLLEDFAYALEQTGGPPGEVERLRDAAAEIREKFAGKEAAHEDPTPYGTQCPPR